MKRILIVLALVVVSSSSLAVGQTNSEVVAKALAVRNAPVCEALALPVGCTDDEALAAWCVMNNKPAGAMCVASDSRDVSQRVATPAVFYAEQQAAQEKLRGERARRLRKATLVLIEIAIADDPAVLAAVCAATKRIPEKDCK